MNSASWAQAPFSASLRIRLGSQRLQAVDPKGGEANAHDLITSPAFIVMKAASEFKDKTTAINQLWQTDFTYLKIIGWGWYYLSTILDDYSRYIIAHRNALRSAKLWEAVHDDAGAGRYRHAGDGAGGIGL